MLTVLLDSARVGGLGVGLFITVLVAALAVLGCFIGWRTEKLELACAIGSIVLIIIVLFFTLAPKGDSSSETGETNKILIPQVMVGVLLGVGFCIGGLGIVLVYLQPEHEPRDL